MLQALTIENYALIRKLDITFQPGLTVVTGETGAGKSIILGALGLVLGQRADTTMLSDNSSKCIVEGSFQLKQYGLNSFFAENDIDYEDVTIIRREINAAGKTRAFINDTPVNLNIIKELGDKLVDIHSQHETLTLRNAYFQLEVLDQYAGNLALLEEYHLHYQQHKKNREELARLREKEKQARLDQDFYTFLFTELQAAGLSEEEQPSLEEELALLSHAGDIKNGIMTILDILDQSEVSMLSKTNEIIRLFDTISAFHPQLQELEKRMKELYVEARDITGELNHLSDQVQVNPARLEQVQNRLDTIYTLQKKHRVNTVSELLVLQSEFDERLQAVSSLEEEINKLELQETETGKLIQDIGNQITEGRKAAIPGVEKGILELLQELGMPDASFEVELISLSVPAESGFDQVRFLFSANKGSVPGEISKIASGGELSRVMLAVKSMVSRQQLLPTLIFDEIDMGISGEIAARVGAILQKLSDTKQLIVITHLPQIAGKGSYHYYVYKTTGESNTNTHMRILTDEERVEEIARMISGDSFSGNTLETARELLLNNK